MRHAPRGCASASISRSPTGITPTIRRSPTPIARIATARCRKPTPEQWQRFTAVLFAQIEELLTDYGRIDLLWFDGGWERSVEAWRSAELEARIRTLQPEILINDRLPGSGDFDTPEQFVPPQPPARPWETCLTMNDSWGWNPTDTHYKSARALVHTLCEVAGRGGNLLLNVSPTGDGSLPPAHVERLDAISWLDGGLRREHRRHHARPRAVAVLRPEHAPRADRLPAPRCSAPTTASRCAASTSSA